MKDRSKKKTRKTRQQIAADAGTASGTVLGAFFSRFFASFFSVGTIVFAASVALGFIAYKSTGLDNRIKHLISIDISEEAQGEELGPGDEQSVNPTVKNTGNDKAFIFIRFDVKATDDGDPVYSFSPDNSSGGGDWFQVDTGIPEEILYCYGDDRDPAELDAGRSVSLPGTLKVDVDNSTYSGFDNDEIMRVKITGCGIGSSVEGLEGASAEDVYKEYKNRGGE